MNASQVGWFPRRRAGAAGRRILAICWLGSTALTLTGCIAEQRGMAGLTVDAGGNPIVVVTTCSNSRLASLDIFSQSGDRTGGEWIAVHSTAPDAVIGLESPPPGWETRVPWSPDSPSMEYYVVARAEDEVRTEQTDFTVNDLAALSPGRVLVGVNNTPNYPRKIVAMADFRREACRKVKER